MNKYALFGKFKTHSGKRDELINILLQASQLMNQAKGCHLYIVCKDISDPDVVWVNELWDSVKDHDDSLSIPGCKELIMQAMPLLSEKPSGGIKAEAVGGKGF